MYQPHRFCRLRAQLTLTFLITSLGMGFALGVPALLLIKRQSYSQAQLLSSQADLTT